MKIAISTSKGGLEDNVFKIFGRSPTFTIINKAEPEKSIVISNPGLNASGGAGIAAAQAIVKSGANIVITVNCGPNALAALLASGIRVYQYSGTVKGAIEELIADKLVLIDYPTTSFHSGTSASLLEKR